MAHTIAIMCSDLHLSHRPPIARANEPDWYDAMARSLRDLKALQSLYGCGVICAGDIFDKWNAPPELINFAIRELPDMYAIPGQHDLPYHDKHQIRKSAFWTLVEHGRVKLIGEKERFSTPGHDLEERVHLYGFPYGEELHSREVFDDGLRVAVIHQYCWASTKKYSGASDLDNVGAHRKLLGDYHVALFGDNHKGFVVKMDGVVIVNPGTFFRRASDEIGYTPMVVLLQSDGSTVPYMLDVGQDLIETTHDRENVITIDLQEFVDGLESLGSGELDFVKALMEAIKSSEVSMGVKRLIGKLIQ